MALDEGITEQADYTELTRIEAAKMIYNALSCKIYVISGMDFSGENSVAYTFERSDDDVLKRVFGCRRVKGKLTLNDDFASGEIGGDAVYFKYSDANEYCDKEYMHYVIDRDGIKVWIAAREE